METNDQPKTPAKATTPEQMLSLRLNSDAVRERFEKIGSSLQFSKEVAFATQSVQKNPILMRCNPMTVVASLLNVSLTGITLNPILGYAYLIPRKVGGVFECCLDVSYKGLIQILTDSGGVKNMYAHVVYEKDKFTVEYGAEPRLIHQPHLGRDKGVVTGVYGVAVLADGEKSFDYMDIEEINYIKGRSEMGKRGSGPWSTDFNEMAKKTILKRMFKYLPKNDRLVRVAEAIAIDNDNNGIDFAAEQKAITTGSNESRVAKGIADALAKTKRSAEPEAVDEGAQLEEALDSVGTSKSTPKKKGKRKSKADVEEIDVPLSDNPTEEEIIEHLETLNSTVELDTYIQGLPTDSLTNRVFGAANGRDAILREQDQ